MLSYVSNVTKCFRSRVDMASRQDSNELPPPYSSVVDDAYLQGFPHPPGYTAISTDDAANETRENSSSVPGQHTDRQQDCLRVSMGNILPSYDAAYTNTHPASTSQTAVVGSYPNCPPPAYTAATSPFSHQQRQQTLPPGENYISISNRIQAVTQSDDASPADGESGEKDNGAGCLCVAFWTMGMLFCFLSPCLL